MVITTKHKPSVEFDLEAGQTEPTLVHFFSDRADPSKMVLPQLMEGAAKRKRAL